MDNQNPLSLPTREPARNSPLSIRLSADERAATNALAAHLGVHVSHMARHFLMQAVRYYAARLAGKEEMQNEGKEQPPIG